MKVEGGVRVIPDEMNVRADGGETIEWAPVW
jgi:hypothetical protein